MKTQKPVETIEDKLNDIIFSKEYPVKRAHLKDCAFVWQDQGVCNCKYNIPRIKAQLQAIITTETKKARIEAIASYKKVLKMEAALQKEQ